MTIGDFFDFDKDEYAARISHYTLDRLRKQEVVKTRQHTAAYCSILTGSAGAIPSMGCSLVLSAYGARRLYVAMSKLELIQAELERRGIALHELQKRDVLIPLGACLVGMGVGLGIEEAAAVATNTITMDGNLPSNSSVSQALSTNPESTISGALHGMGEQSQEMYNAVQNLDNGIPASADLARETVWAQSHSMQEAIGFHAGMAMMESTERGIASLSSNLAATWVMESMTGNVSETNQESRIP